jgi:antitoxin component YwqK of YwqJK toxin-antitoxin module
MFSKFFLVLCFSLTFTVSAISECDTIRANGHTMIICRGYFPNSKQLNWVDSLLDGKRNGAQSVWYRNGSLKSISHYQTGCQIDSLTEFHENGTISTICTYKNCKAEGLSYRFSETGDTLGIYENKNGISVGIHRTWYSHNHLKNFTRYNDSGQKHGLSESWYENGDRKDSIMYKNDDIVEAREYFPNGRIRYWDIYKGDKTQTGSRMTPDGKPCGKIVAGNGTVITYTADGAKRYLEEYVDGVVVSSRKLNPMESPKLK